MNFLLDKLDLLRAASKERFGGCNYSYPSNLTAGLVTAIIAIIMLLVIPSQIEISEKDAVNGRVFPQLLMVLMLICSSWLILKDVYRLMIHRPLEMKTINLYTELKALMIILILVGTYLIDVCTDMFLLGSIFCVLAFLIYFNCRKWLYYLISLSLAVLIWLAFNFGLGVNF